MLKSLAVNAGGMMPMMRMMNNNSELDIMLIDARQAKQSSHKIPTVLPRAKETLDPRAAVTTREDLNLKWV